MGTSLAACGGASNHLGRVSDVSQRIDYVKAASDASGYAWNERTTNPVLAALVYQDAQLNATLALVEQQRVANLIALAGLRVDPSGMPPLRHLAITPNGEFSVGAAPDIAAALGIKGTQIVTAVNSCDGLLAENAALQEFVAKVRESDLSCHHDEYGMIDFRDAIVAALEALDAALGTTSGPDDPTPTEPPC